MQTKIFSIELVTATMQFGVVAQEQATKFADFEKEINDFLSKNPDFTTVEWLQSSASGSYPFTRITAIAKTA